MAALGGINLQDPRFMQLLQQQAVAGMNPNPTGFNPSMMAANASMPNPNMGGGIGGFFRRAGIGLQNGLGKLGQGMFPMDPSATAGMDPQQIQAMRNNAMMKMGLGMMSSASQGARFGEALGTGYFGASSDLNGAMQQAYKNAVMGRQEQREAERDRAQDERFDKEMEYRLAKNKEDRETKAADRAYKLKQSELEQGRWKAEMDATAKWRDQQLKMEETRANRGLSETQRIQVADKIRKEYTTRKQKVLDGTAQAEQILQLAANPSIGKDPSAQTALVYSFGRMLDPESVVREGEYKIMEDARGIMEEMQNILPRLQTGARLTPQQIRRMASVAQQFAGKGQDRMKALDQYYNELSTRRDIDPFEVTGQVNRPAQDRNVIDVGEVIGQKESSGLAFDSNGKLIQVDY